MRVTAEPRVPLPRVSLADLSTGWQRACTKPALPDVPRPGFPQMPRGRAFPRCPKAGLSPDVQGQAFTRSRRCVLPAPQVAAARPAEWDARKNVRNKDFALLSAAVAVDLRVTLGTADGIAEAT